MARAETNHALAYLIKPIGVADLQPAIATAMQRISELHQAGL
jgi:AmiR/NasT family two-component response regulator